MSEGQLTGVSISEASRVWAKIGVVSFGGPAGQIALMHRIVVEEKRWISEARFLAALNFCMLLPGPEAQQLATYVGWLLHGIRGGLIAGLLFILPGALVMLGLSCLYLTVGDLPVLEGLFLGLKAAVVVIVAQAVIRIGGRSLGSARSRIIATTAFLAMFLWNVSFPWVILAAALAGGLAMRAGPAAAQGEKAADYAGTASRRGGPVLITGAAFLVLWLAPALVLLLSLGESHVFSQIAVFFSKMATVTFGGAYAVLSYVSQQAVDGFGWMTPEEMIDGLALAETTPGPLILVTQFVGFIAAYRDPGQLSPEVAGLIGASLTTWVSFAPCFLWIFVLAPHVERLRRNPALAGALTGVTAAVVGVVINLALWFSVHVLFTSVLTFNRWGMRLEVPQWSTIQIVPTLIVLLIGLAVFRFRLGLLPALGIAALIGLVSTAL
ncbi:MAG: chromate efflux transporter [Pseudomonadota bacterium]